MALRAVLALFLVTAAAAPILAKPEYVPESDLHPSMQHQQTVLIVGKVMERYHYRKHRLDDEMSLRILETYLDGLDPNRNFFLADDITWFRETYGKRLDNDLHRSRLDAAYEIYLIFRQRVADTVDQALKILEVEFDFTRREEYVLDVEP